MVHLKNDREIEKIRASALLVSRTLGEVAKHVRPGVTTQELDDVAEAFIRDHGAEPAFKGYRVGRNVYPATLCISLNDVVVHGIPDAVRLSEGDLASVDCGVVLDGFYGDCAFTFSVGDLKEADAALCRTTYEALHLGIGKVRVGNTIGDISEAVQRHCEERGYGVVQELVGHGIGRSLHEDPQVPNVGRAGTGYRLRSGVVLCIEPMINLGTASVSTDGDGWTVRTQDHHPSAHYEHMVAVGEEPEILTTFEYIEEATIPPYAASRTEEYHG